MFGAKTLPSARPSGGAGQWLFSCLGAQVPEAIPGLRIPMPCLEGFAFFPAWRLLLVIVTAGTIAALFALLQFTRFGLVVRAGMRDAEMVRFLGVNLTRSFAVV